MIKRNKKVIKLVLIVGETKFEIVFPPSDGFSFMWFLHIRALIELVRRFLE